MRNLTVKKLHEIVGGRLRLAANPPPHGEAALVQKVVTDSRQVRRGDTFWALKGTQFDGAQFVESAYAQGATGAVVGKYIHPAPGRWSLEVADAEAALRQLARWNRDRFCGRLIGVTGSVGKTTTRQMIAAVLRTRFSGTSSPKNFNNHIGVPLSMLAMEPGHDFAVLEMAASAAGEIGSLAQLCSPQIGVVTRVGDAHLGGFGSLDAVAAAKLELLAGLAPDGWAVLFGDDSRLRKLASPLGRKILWFGRSLENDVVATNVHCHQGRLSFAVDGMSMHVGVWGRHHLAGALAAVAVGRILGVCDAEIAAGLAQFQAPPMRCQISKVAGATIIDDTYNASPMAMKAALELLRDFETSGRRIVVCGDMRELGEAAGALHRALGDQVVTLCGADVLVACGDHAHEVVAGARAAGMPRHRTVACRLPEEVFTHREAAPQPGDVVLVKGSRAMAMDRVVETLQARQPSCAA